MGVSSKPPAGPFLLEVVPVFCGLGGGGAASLTSVLCDAPGVLPLGALLRDESFSAAMVDVEGVAMAIEAEIAAEQAQRGLVMAELVGAQL